MSATTLIEFDDASEHDFDATKLDLVDDKGQLKEQFLASEILFANFDADGNTFSKRGNKELILGGPDNTGQILGGVLDFPNQDKSIATYEAITEIVDDFSFRFKVHMNVITVVTDRDLFSIKSNTDSSEIVIYASNQGGGVSRVKRRVVNSGGGVLDDSIIFIQNFSTDPDFEVSLSFDADDSIKTYHNGDLKLTLAASSFDITDADIVLGDIVDSLADFDDVQLWNEVVDLQTDSAIIEPTSFVLTEEVMLTIIPFILDEITDFSIISDIPVNTALKHFVCIDLIAYFHNGTDWVVSDQTLAQANTPSEIFDNIASLPLVKGIGGFVQIGHIFQSTSGYDTAIIESLTMKFKFQFKPDELRCCVVYGTIVDNSKMPVEGATVRVTSSDKFYNNNFVGPTAKAITNSQGKFTLSVVETQTDDLTVDFTIEYKEKRFENGLESDAQVIFDRKGLVIPNLPTCKFSDLTTP